MEKVTKKSSRAIALLLAALMLLAYMPMAQETAFAAKKGKKPAKVKSVKASVSEDNKVTVTWKKAKNAKKYKVSIKDGKSGLTAVKTAKKTQFVFQGGDGVEYTVKVRGVKGKKKGKWSKAVKAETKAASVPQDVLDKAEADKKAAEDAKAKAEADKKAAEDALAQAEADKKAAEDALAQAEADKKAAEDALAQAEADKKAAEDKQAEDKKASDDAVAAAEQAKKDAEDALAKAEEDKKAAEEALTQSEEAKAKAEEEKKAAEEALAKAEEELEMVDDGDRSTQKDGSMHVVYSTLGMFRTDDAETTIVKKDENTVTVNIKLVAGTSVNKYEKIAFAKMGEEDSAEITAELNVEEAGANESGKMTYTATCSFDLPASLVGKKLAYSMKYNNEEGWHTFTAQPYMIVLTEEERQIYEEMDDGDRSAQNDISMHVVYCTTGMLRILDEGTTVTMSEDGKTATVVAATSKSKTWGKITKLALVKETATAEEKDAAAEDITFADDTYYEDKSVAREITFSIPAEKIGKKIPVCQYKSGEWTDFSAQQYIIVLTEQERRLYAAEKELAEIKDKKAADEVAEAWVKVPAITVDSSEADLAAAGAVIEAYDALTDAQKALVPADVKAEIEAAKAVIAKIKELNAKKAEVIAAIKAAAPANYPTDTNTVTIEGEEYCVMAIDNEANEAKLVKKMPVFDSEGHGIPFDKDGGYNWKDSSLRSFVNDKENGFFKGRDLLYSMSVEKENKYSITKVAWVEDEDDPILTPYNYTTNDRAMLMDFDSFNPCRRDWSAAWNDNSISTWLYRTVPNEDLDEGIVLVEDDDETQDLTYAWFQDYTYYNGVSYNAEPTFNGLSRKVGICPVVYVSIA